MGDMTKLQKQNAAGDPAGNGTGALPSLLPQMQKRGRDQCRKAGDYSHKKCKIKARRYRCRAYEPETIYLSPFIAYGIMNLLYLQIGIWRGENGL